MLHSPVHMQQFPLQYCTDHGTFHAMEGIAVVTPAITEAFTSLKHSAKEDGQLKMNGNFGIKTEPYIKNENNLGCAF